MTNWQAFLRAHGLPEQPMEGNLDKLFRCWLGNRRREWEFMTGRTMTDADFAAFDDLVDRVSRRHGDG